MGPSEKSTPPTPQLTHVHTISEDLSTAGPLMRSNAALLASYLKSLSQSLGSWKYTLHAQLLGSISGQGL